MPLKRNDFAPNDKCLVQFVNEAGTLLRQESDIVPRRRLITGAHEALFRGAWGISVGNWIRRGVSTR